jgi:hypothetical protein
VLRHIKRWKTAGHSQRLSECINHVHSSASPECEIVGSVVLCCWRWFLLLRAESVRLAGGSLQGEREKRLRGVMRGKKEERKWREATVRLQVV